MATRSIIVCDVCGKDIKPDDRDGFIVLLALCAACQSDSIAKTMPTLCDVIARLSSDPYDGRNKRSVFFDNGILTLQVGSPTNIRPNAELRKP